MKFFSKLHSRRSVAIGAGLLSAAMLTAACGSSSSSAASTTTAAGGTSAKSSSTPYVIHADLSETGQGSFLGSREAKALTGLFDSVNSSGGIDGHQIKLDIKDNQSSPSTSVSIASQWVAQKVPFIFNGSIAAAAKAVDHLATSNGPVIYDLTPVNPAPADSYIFNSGISYKLDLEAILNTLQSKGITKVAFLNTTDVSGASGWPVMQSLIATSKYKGIQVVSHQTYDPTAVSATTQMSVIKAANPQALIIWTTGAPIGTALHAQNQLGMSSIPVYTSAGNAVSGELHHLASVLPTHIYFPVGPLYLSPSSLPSNLAPVVSKFQSMVAKSGGTPNDGWGLAYASGLMLVSALKSIGVNATAAQLKHYFQHLSNFPNIYGVFNLSSTNHNGISLSGVYMSTWNGSAFVKVSGPGGLPQG